MNRDARTVAVVLALGGVAVVALGVWLPWLTVTPGYDGPVPGIYVSGMETGIAGQDYPLLALAVVSGAGVAASRRWQYGGPLALATGTSVAVLTLWWAVSTTGLDGRYLGVFVLDKGAPVTLAGGVLLAVAGGIYTLMGGGPVRTATDPSELRDV